MRPSQLLYLPRAMYCVFCVRVPLRCVPTQLAGARAALCERKEVGALPNSIAAPGGCTVRTAQPTHAEQICRCTAHLRGMWGVGQAFSMGAGRKYDLAAAFSQRVYLRRSVSHNILYIELLRRVFLPSDAHVLLSL